MKDRHYWILIGILCICLIITNVILIYRRHSNKKNYTFQTDVISLFDKKVREINCYIELSMKLFSESKKNMNEKEDVLFNNSDKVVFYIRDEACVGCVLSVLQDLDILSDNIGYKKILVIGSFSNEENFWNIIGSYSELFKCHNCPELKIMDESEFNYAIFLVTSDNRICLFYINELFPEYRQKYFREILPEYFNSKLVQHYTGTSCLPQN